MVKKYRPSNGSEGCWFESEFCDKCVKDDPEKEIFCDIVAAAYLFGVEEPEYPSQWRYCPATGKPVCTDFRDKPEPVKSDPNQMSF